MLAYYSISHYKLLTASLYQPKIGSKGGTYSTDKELLESKQQQVQLIRCWKRQEIILSITIVDACSAALDS